MKLLKHSARMDRVFPEFKCAPVCFSLARFGMSCLSLSRSSFSSCLPSSSRFVPRPLFCLTSTTAVRLCGIRPPLKDEFFHLFLLRLGGMRRPKYAPCSSVSPCFSLFLFDLSLPPTLPSVVFNILLLFLLFFPVVALFCVPPLRPFRDGLLPFLLINVAALVVRKVSV